MSVPALCAAIWALGALITFSYLFYTDHTDTSLSEDERLSGLGMFGYALIWPLLAISWIVMGISTGLRAVRRWFTAD